MHTGTDSKHIYTYTMDFHYKLTIQIWGISNKAECRIETQYSKLNSRMLLNIKIIS